MKTLSSRQRRYNSKALRREAKVKPVELFINGTDCGLGNRFKAQVIDNGKVVHETDWASNLILDQGMNNIATTKFCDLFTRAVIGTGNTPTEDDSGATTATTVGATCTASGAFFAAGDVGKLLRFDTGEKSMITGFTSSTVVTLASSLGVIAQPFTMYRVAQVGLATEVKRSNTYLTGAGNCETVLSGSTYTNRRTYDFTAEVANTNYAEVGFANTSSAGNNINARGLFAGGAVTVLIGQQLRVIYDFIVTVSPTSPRAREVVITGWPSLAQNVTVDATTDLITLASHGLVLDTKIKFQGTGAPGGVTFGTSYYVIPNDANSFKIAAAPGGSAIDITTNGSGVQLLTNTKGFEQLTKHALAQVNSAGTTTSQDADGGGNADYANEPSMAKNVCISTDANALPTWPTSSNGSPSIPTGGAVALAKDTYVNGNFFVTWRATIPTTGGNSSAIRKLYVANTGASNGINGLCYLFDQKQEKTSINTLTVVFKYAWDRDFS